jgi:cytochrome c biogenesis protein CcdA/thiol-disulfide isomerase/thioredoxin
MITLILIGLVGGLITGISPCILPVLPVIFVSGGAQGARITQRPAATSARSPIPKQASGPGVADQGSITSFDVMVAERPPTEPRPDGRRPYLVVAGLTLSFSVFTLIGTLVLSALPLPQDIIRWVGLLVLVLLGLGLIVPRIEQVLEKPFSRIPQRRVGTDRGAFVLGLALGAVYVPCAGPVLAAITVAGATGEIGGHTVVLTLSFAIGTALPLLAFALAGRRLAERLRTFRRHQRRIRIGAGVVMIALAVALTFNVTDAIQRSVPDYTTALNRGLDTEGKTAKALSNGKESAALAACEQNAGTGKPALSNCGAAPDLTGITSWLNTPNGTGTNLTALRGKVVLVDFWAYSCINCQRAIAHVNAWYSAYQNSGFVVIGVHTPEYAFEHVAGNVAAGAKRLGISYPVALDNDYKTWDAYSNESWPADYLIDTTGTVRLVTVGEGDYPGTEALIRRLLTTADPHRALPAATQVADTTPSTQLQSPETYLGGQRAQYYGGDGGLYSGTSTFSYPSSLARGAFALTGTWSVADEALTSKAGAGIELNYLANDIYLDVGGTGTLTATVDGKTTTYPVSGAPDIYTLRHGATQGQGTLRVTLSPGLSAYSFTFG